MAHGTLKLQEGPAEEALADFEKALEIRRRTLGEDHPTVLASACGVAVALHCLGRDTESLLLLQQTVRRLQQLHGPDDFELAGPYMGLGDAYRVAGQLDEAETFLHLGLQLRQAHVGPCDDSIIPSVISLGRLALSRQALDEAQAWFQQALEVSERMLGADHPNVANALYFLADVHERKGQPEDALALAKRRVPISERAYGREGVNALHARMTVVSLLFACARPDEAEALFEELLPAVAAIGDGSPTDKRLLVWRTGLHFLKTGRPVEALPYLRANAQLAASRLPADNEQRELLSWALVNLVVCAWLASEPSESRTHFVRLAHLLDETGSNDGDREASFAPLVSLAEWFEAQDALDQFIALHREAVEDGCRIPAAEELVL